MVFLPNFLFAENGEPRANRWRERYTGRGKYSRGISTGICVTPSRPWVCTLLNLIIFLLF